MVQHPGTTHSPTNQPASTVADLRRAAQVMWPEDSAESWDRVGLVSGRNDAPLRRVLLAVDAVAGTVSEALDWDADVLFTHHPLLLRGVHSVAEDTAKGHLLAELIRGNCALYTAHTNADVPDGGVSAVIAERLELQEVRAIEESSSTGATSGNMGIGREGVLRAPEPLRAFAQRVARVLPETVSGIRVAGDPDRLVQRIALLGGAGDSLLDHPLVRGADVYLTSDLRHHPAQESLELSQTVGGPALIDVAHWASESLWLEGAATRLQTQLPGVEVRVSTLRTDPWTFSISPSTPQP